MWDNIDDFFLCVFDRTLSLQKHKTNKQTKKKKKKIVSVIFLFNVDDFLVHSNFMH